MMKCDGCGVDVDETATEKTMEIIKDNGERYEPRKLVAAWCPECPIPAWLTDGVAQR